jgi:hypothetical protein
VDYFLAESFLSSFLAGSLLVAAGAVVAAGAGAAAAGLASTFFSSFLAGSAAKAVADKATVAIKVAIVFISEFPLYKSRRTIPLHIYNAVAQKFVYS